jgi:feruloyl-CoA synthase
VRLGGATHATLERQADGACVLRATETLRAYPERISDRLEHWAQHTPDRIFVAQRGDTGSWRFITYAQMLKRALSVGQALLDHGLNAEKPLLILSGNDLEHMTLMMAAMWVGVPTVSASPSYALLSTDHRQLRQMVDKVTPGLAFASDSRYAPALDAAVPCEIPVVLTQQDRSNLRKHDAIPFSRLLSARPSADVDTAHRATSAQTVVKIMFTSGSTQAPKGVVITHRMWSANQQMLLQCMPFLEDDPPILVDWLPWSHTFGGNHNLGLVLYNGGTLYIDEGKPTAEGWQETLRNLREISPTVYFNVPKGYAGLVDAMANDLLLREMLLRRLKVFFCGGAGLSSAVWTALDQQAHSSSTLVGSSRDCAWVR